MAAADVPGVRPRDVSVPNSVPNLRERRTVTFGRYVRSHAASATRRRSRRLLPRRKPRQQPSARLLGRRRPQRFHAARTRGRGAAVGVDRSVTFCLMPNHFHLVVHVPQAGLSEGMQFLNGGHARRTNGATAAPGTCSATASGRSRSRGDEQLLETIRYVVRNPVRAGLCATPEHWRWSSHRAVRRADRPRRRSSLSISSRRPLRRTSRTRRMSSFRASSGRTVAPVSDTDRGVPAAQERMTASTSSRLRSISSCERASRFRRSSGSVFDGRTLKCQSSAVDGHAVEVRDLPSRAERSFELLQLRVHVAHRRVDLAGDEVARAVRLEDLATASARASRSARASAGTARRPSRPARSRGSSSAPTPRRRTPRPPRASGA